MLESIKTEFKTEFECNEALLEDFPASIYASVADPRSAEARFAPLRFASFSVA